MSKIDKFLWGLIVCIASMLVLGAVLISVGQVYELTLVTQVGNVLLLVGMVFALLFLVPCVIGEHLQ